MRRPKELFLLAIACSLTPLVVRGASYQVNLHIGNNAIANQVDIGVNSLVDVFGYNLPDYTTLIIYYATNCPSSSGPAL
jgi:hypothetical protein